MQSERIVEGKQLVRDLCEELQVSYEDIIGPSRKREYSDPRAVIMAALRFGRQLGVRDIATIMNRHHSTMFNSVILYKDVLRNEYEINILKCLTIEERELYYKNLSGV